jgi:hypothetical protein
VNVIAAGDLLGLCDQKVHINMYPILDGYVSNSFASSTRSVPKVMRVF